MRNVNSSILVIWTLSLSTLAADAIFFLKSSCFVSSKSSLDISSPTCILTMKSEALSEAVFAVLGFVGAAVLGFVGAGVVDACVCAGEVLFCAALGFVGSGVVDTCVGASVADAGVVDAGAVAADAGAVAADAGAIAAGAGVADAGVAVVDAGAVAAGAANAGVAVVDVGAGASAAARVLFAPNSGVDAHTFQRRMTLNSYSFQ